MLGGAWILITVILLITAIVLKQSPLFIVAALFFFTSGIARLWSRYSLTRLEYRRKLSTNRAFCGDSITLDLSITNNKFLPLPWVMAREETPDGVTLLKGKVSPSHKPGRKILSSFISLGWYHRLTRRYPMECTKRGLYYFGPATVASGDPFGFFRKRESLEDEDRLLVYPRILPLEDIGIPSRHPFGDLRVKRHIFEDPVLVMSTRDYVRSDPMKNIAWKATARLQKLQSRVFEHTTSMDMALFLDTRTTAETAYWSMMSPDFLETGILAAASIADHAYKEGYKLGFYANEYYHRSNHLMKLSPSSHPDQFKYILEALAQVQGLPALPAEQLLNREARQLNWEATIVMITAVPSTGLLTVLKRFQRAGRRVGLIVIGSAGQSAGTEGILTYHVSEEVYRRNMDSLRLVNS